MPKPAAFMGVMHVCPQVTVIVPHVGGSVIGTAATVLIGAMPAAVVTDLSICVGPPDGVALGSFTVFAAGKPMARMGDMSNHGGAIVMGNPTVIIGD